MKTGVPPPDKRLDGKVTILPFPSQRDILTVASNAQPKDVEPTYVEQEIQRLSKLSTPDYELERKAVAKRLGIRTTILDKAVADERNRADGGARQGRTFGFVEPDPWHEPVDGVRLLNDIVQNISRHVVLSDHSADTIALWVLHTYLVNNFGISPRLAISSPEKGCGKTTLLDVLGHLVPRPLIAANISVAATFRTIEKYQPTLLIDEADTFLKDNDELRGILNSGHRQDGVVVRTVGDDLEPRAFHTYSACAIALIGKLPATLADRSVAIELRRRRSDENIQMFRFDQTAHLDVLARQAARWAADDVGLVRGADPKMPGELYNRAADNWRPLIAVADALRGEWPERARRAAIAAVTSQDTGDSYQSLLLSDIRSIFSKRNAEKLASAEIIEELVKIEGRPWTEFRRGKPISPYVLARLLSAFKIFPSTIRIRDETPKGYKRADFEDTFNRYLPAKEI